MGDGWEGKSACLHALYDIGGVEAVVWAFLRVDRRIFVVSCVDTRPSVSIGACLDLFSAGHMGGVGEPLLTTRCGPHSRLTEGGLLCRRFIRWLPRIL